VTDIDRSKGLILLTIVVAATVLGGIALTAAASDTDENTNDQTSLVVGSESGRTAELLTLTNTNESTNGPAGFMPWMMPGPFGGPRGEFRRGGLLGRDCFGPIEVSDEFEDNVVGIAESDEDVQVLLDDGYNVTGVRPIIKTVVDGDGNIVTKAIDAIVILIKEETGRASVWVNLEEGKVTEIMILTRTIIEKP
jgi:hypothetical protein